MNIKILKNKKGFTIIELVVVIAIFLFVVGAAIGIFLSIVQSQRKVLAEQQFLNQISYGEEYMSKALRMASVDETGGCLDGNAGYIYLLTQPDATTHLFKGVKFINQTGDASGNPVCQEFYLDNTTDPQNPVLMEVRDGGTPVPITYSSSSGVKVTSIRFAINGVDGSQLSAGICEGSPLACGAKNSDESQPRVTILMNVQIPGDSQAPRAIQTTVSQRNLNVY
jgi:prepilin-type N-terminal cleavage/methylation domain-containing protein